MKKRCVFSIDVSAGSVISRDMICFKRASQGVYADDISDILGKVLISDCVADQPLTQDILRIRHD